MKFPLLAHVSDYSFVRAILEGPVLVATLIGFAYGYRRIQKDNNRVLEKGDVLLYKMSLLQTIVLFINITLMSFSYITYLSSILKLFQSATITIIFAYYILSQEYHESLERAIRYIFIGLICLWVLMILDTQSSNDCGQSLWQVFCSAYTIETSLLAYFGTKGLMEVMKSERECAKERTDPIAKSVTLDILNQQKSNYFLLVLTSVLSAVCSILACISKFSISGGEDLLCSNIIADRSALYGGYLVMIDTLGDVALNLSVLYAFFYKKRHLFEDDMLIDKTPSEVFDSIRSELIENMQELQEAPRESNFHHN